MVWESHISPAVQQGRCWMKKGASEEGLRNLHRSKGQVSVLIWNLYIGTLCKLLFAECISVAYLTKVREIHRTRWSLWTLLLLSCFSCVRLCDSMDCSLPGSSVHEILQRILEWIALPSSRGSSYLTSWSYVSCIFTIRTTWEALLHPLPIPIGPFIHPTSN